MKKTKILSLITATALTLSVIPSAFAATTVETKAVNFAEMTVNSNRTGFSKGFAGLNYSNVAQDNRRSVYGNAKLYKFDNIFGLAEGEYGMEMIAREQRGEQPYISYVPAADSSLENDFYLQTILYIGESRANDLLRLGGEYNDGGARKNHYVWFGGDGRVYADGQGSKRGRFGAVYTPNNWYNVTLAYDAETKTVSQYFDGCIVNKNFQGTTLAPSTVASNITNFSIAARFETMEADNMGVPSWIIMKDMKVVAGEYVPANSNTDVTSSVYTVDATSFNIDNHWAAPASYVSNVADGVTVAEFLGNINAPEGAEKSVVTIDEYSKKTIVADASDVVADDMSLLVKAVDGSLKLYDIKVSVSAEKLPVITLAEGANANKYAVADKVVTVMPHTKVSVLKSVLAAGEGTTYTVVKGNGTEMTDDEYVTDTTTIVAVKGNVKATYTIAIKNTVVKSITSSLEALANGTSLYEGTYNGAFTGAVTYSGPNIIYPIGSKYGNTAGTIYPAGTGSYKVTKDVMPESGIAAWKMETPVVDGSSYTGWILHESEQTYNTASNSANGSKIITNFKVYLADANAKAYFQPMHYRTDTGKGFELSNQGWRNGYGDKVVFENGQVFLGGKAVNNSFDRATNYKITYENAKEYDVTLVQNTAAAANGVIYSDIYIDGVKQGVQHNNGLVTAPVDGYRSFKVATAGNVYFGGLTVYMADDYSPVAAEEDNNADLEIISNDDTTEIFIADPLYHDMPTIKTYLSTVGELRSNLDSKVNTRLEILDPTATVVLADTEEIKGDMFVKVEDVNNKENVVYYLISDIMNFGEFSFEETDDGIMASRTLKAYKNENKVMRFALASYNADGDLLGVQLVEKKINAVGDWELSATLAEGAASYKVMLWDANNIPYTDYEVFEIEE